MEISVCRTGPFKVNTFIVPLSSTEAFVVDIGGNVQSVCNILKERGLIPVALICTHGHFDHILGLCDFHKNFPDVPIAIHKNESNCLGNTGKQILLRDLSLFGLDDFISFTRSIKHLNTDIDIMIEAKGKDEALFRLVRGLKYKTNYKFIDDTTFIV